MGVPETGREGVWPVSVQPRLWRSVPAALHLHVNRHPKTLCGPAKPTTGQRHGLAGIPCHGDPYQVLASDNAVGRIELDPAGTRQINLTPGVRGTAYNRRR